MPFYSRFGGCGRYTLALQTSTGVNVPTPPQSAAAAAAATTTEAPDAAVLPGTLGLRVGVGETRVPPGQALVLGRARVLGLVELEPLRAHARSPGSRGGERGGVVMLCYVVLRWG